MPFSPEQPSSNRFASPRTGFLIPLRSLFPGVVTQDRKLFYDGNIYRISGESVASWAPEEIAGKLLEKFSSKGLDLFTDVIGEFTLVISARDEGYAYRSLTSSRQLYYSSTHLSDCLALLVDPKRSLPLDEEYLWHFLMRRNPVPHRFERTPFSGIKRVPAGHCLRFGPKGLALTSIDYRRFDATTNYSKDVHEAGAELRETFTEIISDRVSALRGRPVACELSGGLDSSFVCSLLARHVPKVTAYMFTYPSHPSHEFSERCAQAVADRYPNISFRKLPPEHFFPFDLSTATAYSDEPSKFFWQGAVFCSKMAQELPSNSVIFSGIGSDQLFLRTPMVFPWLLERGEFRRFFNGLADYSKCADRGIVSLLRQSLLALAPGPFYTKYLPLLRKVPFDIFNFEDINAEFQILDEITWILTKKPGGTSALQRQVAREEALEHHILFGRQAKIRSPLSSLASPRFSLVPYLQPHGISYEMPFYDLRLLQRIYRDVSWHLIQDWKTPYKNLLREAEKGIVPEMTRTRIKNEFNFMGFLGDLLRQNQEYVRSLLTDPHTEILDCFDRRLLVETFERLLFGMGTNTAGALKALIFYLIWLRNFKAALGDEPTTRLPPEL